jgi:hypothetical protein
MFPESEETDFSFAELFRNLDGSLFEKSTQLEFAKIAKRNLENILMMYRALPEFDKPLFLQHQRSQMKQRAAGNSSHEPEITFRLQKDGQGMFGGAHDKNVLSPKITSAEFFAWFAPQTTYGGTAGPYQLKFTFKDALPNRMMKVIAKG